MLKREEMLFFKKRNDIFFEFEFVKLVVSVFHQMDGNPKTLIFFLKQKSKRNKLFSETKRNKPVCD
jgi:hypothetical protein